MSALRPIAVAEPSAWLSTRRRHSPFGAGFRCPTYAFLAPYPQLRLPRSFHLSSPKFMRRYAPAPVLALLVATSLVAPIVAPVVLAHAETVAPYGACTGPTPKISQDAAKTLFGLGKKSYESGNDAEAIKYWRDSFEKDCNATPMLLNLANAYQRAGNNDGAILSLETYLKREPAAEDAATIRARIDNIKSKSKPATSAPATTTAPPALTNTAPPPPTSSAPPPPAPVDDHQKFNYIPWVVAGGGLILGAVGTGLAISANGEKSDVADKAKKNPCNDANPGLCAQYGKESDDAAKKATTFGIIGGLGGAAMVGGIVWGVLTLPKKGGEPPPAAAFAPVVTPGYSGLSLTGRF